MADNDWQVSWLSTQYAFARSPAFPSETVAEEVDAEAIVDYSCGYSSGITPDSLLCRPEIWGHANQR